MPESRSPHIEGSFLFPDEGHGWRKIPNRVKSTLRYQRGRDILARVKPHPVPVV